MNPILLQQLKDAGFPLIEVSGDPLARRLGLIFVHDNVQYYEPTVEELIDACGENFGYLNQHVERKLFEAGCKIEKDKPTVRGFGATPREALAAMYIAWINGIK